MSDPLDRLNAALTGRYRLEREIGRGGMAVVYLAEDLRHDRRVAIKVLDPALAAAIGAERFLSEIKTTANLQHPNILPLFDSGQADGFLFYVMPFVEGESLGRRLGEHGALPVETAVRIAAEVAEALDHAHRHEIVHRDIKPANVLLVDDRPLVADFGIALEVRDAKAARLTQTGHSLGTPGYMSPEQATGERELDHRSDIYSIGALAFEMLVGAPPFADVAPLAALSKVLTEGVPDVRTQRADVPASVAEVVREAMSKEPADRHPSAGVLAAALRASITPAASHSRGGKSMRWLGVAAVVAAVAFGAVWLQGSREARWARVEAMPEITRLLGDGEVAAAYSLAARAVQALPDDPSSPRSWTPARFR